MCSSGLAEAPPASAIETAIGQPRREPKRSCKPHVPPSKQWGSVHPPETVWPSTSGPRTVAASSNRCWSIAQIAQTAASFARRHRRLGVRFVEHGGI